MQSEDRLRAIERATDVPLLILALAMVPLLVAPFVADLNPAAERFVFACDWFIWAAFAADYGVKIAVAPRRLEYAKAHPLEGAMVVLPFLRPLRIARLLRVARLTTVLGLNVNIVRELASQKGTKLIVGAVLVCVVAGAGGVFLAERNEPGSNITSFGDALWWAATTVTTVGYGDFYPTTPEGRGIAIALMLFGIAALTALTAAVAAMLVREHEAQDSGNQLDELLEEVRALRAEVAEIKAQGTN